MSPPNLLMCTPAEGSVLRTVTLEVALPASPEAVEAEAEVVLRVQRKEDGDGREDIGQEI